MVRPADPAGSGLWGLFLGPWQMVTVSFYVDGFNLYHALLRLKDPKVEWLDLHALCLRLIQPKTEQITAINYFSAYADWLPDKMRRHREYVRALEATGVTPILGHFKVKDRKCIKCKATWVAYEEKKPMSASVSRCSTTRTKTNTNGLI
jgi:hypothetical protein